jgi:hypothetical protein
VVRCNYIRERSKTNAGTMNKLITGSNKLYVCVNEVRYSNILIACFDEENEHYSTGIRFGLGK